MTGVATVLTITGSLGPGSGEHPPARPRRCDRAGRRGGGAVHVDRGPAALPPDVDAPAGGPVAAFRAEIGAADAVLIATPEYAHALPGALKDALDWVVGSGELYGKRVAVVSAAPRRERGTNAREMLERTLRAQGADVVSNQTVLVPKGSGPEADAELGTVIGRRSWLGSLSPSAGLLGPGLALGGGA